ncbi:MAG TPA: sulfite exporter TauE/SafE family protein [Chitinophagales bacterium]|nr:sulfite exporter TauE/SafE family protein [Chitinophagales bacterium]
MQPEFIIPIIIFCGALIYATFGFGDALFAMPFLSVLLGIKTATPLMTLNGCTLATILFVRHYKEIDWKSAKKLIIASAFGIPVGIYFLKNGNEQITKIILGCIITGVSIYNLFLKKENKTIHLHPNLVYIFGFIAGVLGGAFNTGGPPIVIFGTLNGWSHLQFISTLQGYFLPSDLFILVCQFFAGLLNKHVINYYLIGLPFLLLGLISGNQLRKKIPEGKFNKYVFLLLLLIGVLFIIRSTVLL